MASAECNNDSCGHSWGLQKAPGEYTNGVTCPQCGSTDVAIVGEANNAPARQEQPQQGGGAPARQQDAPGAAASAFALMDGDVPTQQKAQAAQGLLGGLGNIAQQFFDFQDQKQRAMEKRTENVELSESNLPSCKNEIEEEMCGYQFGPEDIGLSASRVRCPMCGAVYDIEGPA